MGVTSGGCAAFFLARTTSSNRYLVHLGQFLPGKPYKMDPLTTIEKCICTAYVHKIFLALLKVQFLLRNCPFQNCKADRTKETHGSKMLYNQTDSSPVRFNIGYPTRTRYSRCESEPEVSAAAVSTHGRPRKINHHMATANLQSFVRSRPKATDSRHGKAVLTTHSHCCSSHQFDINERNKSMIHFHSFLRNQFVKATTRGKSV